DSGVHAPASVVAGGHIEVRFTDHRADKTNPPISVDVTAPGQGTFRILREWFAVDDFGHFGAAVGLLPLNATVTFQVVENDTGNPVSSFVTQTAFSKH